MLNTKAFGIAIKAILIQDIVLNDWEGTQTIKAGTEIYVNVKRDTGELNGEYFVIHPEQIKTFLN